MSSLDTLAQTADGPETRAGAFLGMKMLLAEYRRAVAAEELYEHLRGGSGSMPQTRAARSETVRCVFDRFYSAE